MIGIRLYNSFHMRKLSISIYVLTVFVVVSGLGFSKVYAEGSVNSKGEITGFSPPMPIKMLRYNSSVARTELRRRGLKVGFSSDGKIIMSTGEGSTFLEAFCRGVGSQAIMVSEKTQNSSKTIISSKKTQNKGNNDTQREVILKRAKKAEEEAKKLLQFNPVNIKISSKSNAEFRSKYKVVVSERLDEKSNLKRISITGKQIKLKCEQRRRGKNWKKSFKVRGLNVDISEVIRDFNDSKAGLIDYFMEKKNNNEIKFSIILSTKLKYWK